MAIRTTVSYSKSGKVVEKTLNLTRGRAIRLKCLDCSGGSWHEVRGCRIVKFPLWVYRAKIKRENGGRHEK